MLRAKFTELQAKSGLTINKHVSAYRYIYIYIISFIPSFSMKLKHDLHGQQEEQPI